MPQPKGHTGNPNGRPPGSKNKATAGLRKRINDFLSDNWEKMQADFETLEPKDRLNFYEKLIQYGLPKLQSTQLLTDPAKLSDEQLEVIMNEILDRDDSGTED